MTHSDSSSLFPLGTVVGFHGLRGEMKIRPITNNPSLLLDATKIEIVKADGSKFSAVVKDLKLDRRLLLLTLADYPDRNSVEALIDAKVFVERGQLRGLDDDEWWVNDLVGLQAYTTDGRFVGTVSSIVDSGNQLLEITEPGGARIALIPFVRDLVPVVDIKSGRVEIKDIPGLLEFV